MSSRTTPVPAERAYRVIGSRIASRADHGAVDGAIVGEPISLSDMVGTNESSYRQRLRAVPESAQ